MNRRRILLASLFALAAAASAGRAASADSGKKSLADLAREAVSEDARVSRAAIAALRGHGPEGLEALFKEHGDALRLHAASEGVGPAVPDASAKRLIAAIDAVAKQRDASAARLFWHTDVEKAKAAAKKEGKPILSLWMLGNLDEEHSCANSRFFRTVLYANAEVSKVLRERFVLHWKSVRPVPRVTIDFGDGRKIDRTICGNSIHYVLDAQGRVVDALPGLYGPKAFLRELARAEEAAKKSEGAGEKRFDFLKSFHEERASALAFEWQADLGKAGRPVEAAFMDLARAPEAGGPPAALEAAPLAMGKGMVEMPVLVALAPSSADLEKGTDEAAWEKIAALHAKDSRLDDSSKAMVRRKHPSAAAAAMRAATSKMFVEDPLVRVVAKLEDSIALDTVRNEYLLHRRIHEWLAGGEAKASVEELNEKVYADLFLTPSSDPWLGLVPDDTYAALEGEGLVTLEKGKSE